MKSLNKSPLAIGVAIGLAASTGAMASSAGTDFNKDWYQYLSPLGWEHINLTGDYIWHEDKKAQQGKFRTLRTEKNH